MTNATPDGHVGDIGFQVFLLTGVDVSTASGLKIRYRKPDGTEGEWVGSATTKNSLDGVEYVTTDAGDLDQAGTWVLDVEVSGLATFTGTAGGSPPPVTMLIGRPRAGA